MDNDDKRNFEKLHKKAEEFLKKYPKESELELSEAEKLKLIHELEVYRVELEMQQEELSRTKEQIESLSKKYDELFDLHNRFIIHFLKKGGSMGGNFGTT
jgi:hypothetical protein